MQVIYWYLSVRKFRRLPMNSDRFRQVATLPSFFEDAKSSPYFHRNRERIIAHFMIRYTALLIYRLLKVTLNRYDKQLHFTTRNIIEPLENMNVANFADICYSTQYTGSQTLKALETCFPLGLERKLFSSQRPKCNSQKKSLKNF